MRRSRMFALPGVLALAAATALSATASATPAKSASPFKTSTSAVSAAESASGYIVLAKEGAAAQAVADRLTAAGATVSSVNTDIGMIAVSQAPSDFLATARGLEGVHAAATNGIVGRSPKPSKPNADVLNEAKIAAKKGEVNPRSAAAKKGKKGASDPLDSYLWGMDMMNVPAAHKIEMGDKRVKVGVMDTGVDGTHPDLAANFDTKLSRNFTTDMVDVDGDCEYDGCVDPANVDDNGHGTHVAGTMAAAMNGMGVSGVAPEVGIVNVRAGQDSGYFFLDATANALTYSGDVGLDVVNMSFYVDPWAYNCAGGAPEDTPEQAAEQDMIIETMKRALNYAHDKGVTLVGALGNNFEDLSNPRPDSSSPDYPVDNEHDRTIDNANCWDLPVEGPHVLGVSAVGPTGKKADYSNYATDLTSGELEISAPGGWFRDGFGTDTFRTNENLILSTAPMHVLQEEGSVDEAGDITEQGEALGVMKECTSKPAKGAVACGYYQFLQGTSMASPHAAGVAALAVSAHGKVNGKAGFGLAPDTVKSLLMSTATKTACPAAVITYQQEGRPSVFNARCVGTADFNSIYGAGIANALGVVQ